MNVRSSDSSQHSGKNPVGLKIISEQPVRISQNLPDRTIFVVGTSGKVNFQPVSTSSTDPFNIQAGASNDVIVTAAGADTVLGGEGNNTIDTGGGNDKIVTGGGSDFLTAGDGNDFVTSGAGDDQVFGGNGNDTVDGGAGSDELLGGAGNDNLKGGAGNDILTPGVGRDTLSGGAGRDRFRFEKGSTGGKQLDKITDFNPRQDIIEISRSLLPGSKLKQLKKSDFEVVDSIRSDSSTAKLIYEKSSGTIFYNPVKGVDVPLLKIQADLNGISSSNFKLF